MDMNKKVYKIILCIILFLIIIGMYGYVRIFKSYGYVSNTELIRLVVKNTAGFYYDRGGFIQYDNSFLDDEKTIKRSEYFSYMDANRNDIRYVNQVDFIYNVFKTSINLDIKSLVGDLTIDNFYMFGKRIYNNINNDDDRKNVLFNDGEYVIDFYDNYVSRLSGSLVVIGDRHFLTMYVKNQELDDDKRNKIFSKLKDTLCVGDVLLFGDSLLLYVDNGKFLYATGDDYDYEVGNDRYEDSGIKEVDIDYLNDITNNMYLFNSEEIYLYRFLNISGYWGKLPNDYHALNNYYSNSLVPNIKIEKFGNISNNSDVYLNDEIIITIKITNNSSERIIIPLITDKIDNQNIEYLSNSYVDAAYMNGELNFSDISLDGNSIKEISYKVKVVGDSGVINFDNTKIGELSLNNISYNIAKKIDFTRLINGGNNIISNYKRLYNIDISEDKFGEINSKIIVNNLYGGRKLKENIDRVKYIDNSILITGDVILYDDNISMYVDEIGDEYIVDKNNIRLDIDVDLFFDSLLSKDEFVIIRPSYLYDDIILKFGDLMVDHEQRIIYLRRPYLNSDVYSKMKEFSKIEMKDIDNNVLNMEDSVKTGNKIVLDGNEYYISLLGDINGDGLINTGDVFKLHRYVLGKIESLEKYYLASSYINDDNLINTGDVFKLHRYVLGKIDNLE